jgi:hypothetical protein
MLDIIRKVEYEFLRNTCRPNIGKYVLTETVSCHLHDSNLVNVELSRMLKKLYGCY